MSEVDELSNLAGGAEKKKAAELVGKINAHIASLNEANKDLKSNLSDVVNSLQHLADNSDKESRANQIAEHQRACDQYVYRDRLLVQEFYFAIVVVGLAGNLIRLNPFSLVGVTVAVVTSAVLIVLWIHIGHLRVDRNLMWDRAMVLEDQLTMAVMLGIWNKSYADDAVDKRSRSGTEYMVNAVLLFSVVWLIIAIGSAASFNPTVKSVYDEFQYWNAAEHEASGGGTESTDQVRCDHTHRISSSP